MSKVISREYVEKNYIHKDKIMKMIKNNNKQIEELKSSFPNFYKLTDKYLLLELINNILKGLLEETNEDNNTAINEVKEK